MSEFGEWLREVDTELDVNVKRLLLDTNARSAAIGFWANLPMFMDLYSMWQDNCNPIEAVRKTLKIEGYLYRRCLDI